jgi:hypothetical protein
MVSISPFIARLKPGVSVQEAEAEGTALIQQLRRDHPSSGPPDQNPTHLASEWEKQGIAQSELRPPRKYYELTPSGREVLAAALNRYRLLAQTRPIRGRMAKPSRT